MGFGGSIEKIWKKNDFLNRLDHSSSFFSHPSKTSNWMWFTKKWKKTWSEKWWEHQPQGSSVKNDDAIGEKCHQQISIARFEWLRCCWFPTALQKLMTHASYCHFRLSILSLLCSRAISMHFPFFPLSFPLQISTSSFPSRFLFSNVQSESAKPILWTS